MCCVQQLEEEWNRRQGLHVAAAERQRVIRENYAPLHHHLYQLQVSAGYLMLWIA